MVDWRPRTSTRTFWGQADLRQRRANFRSPSIIPVPVQHRRGSGPKPAQIAAISNSVYSVTMFRPGIGEFEATITKQEPIRANYSSCGEHLWCGLDPHFPKIRQPCPGKGQLADRRPIVATFASISSNLATGGDGC